MKKTLILIYFLAVLLPLTSLSSCSAANKITSTAAKTTSAAHNSTLEKFHLPQFSTLNAAKCKFSINYKERNFSISSSVKMITDSLIQLSITPFLGIEMYRAVLLPDSVIIIDKGNHNYYITDYSFFQKKFGVAINFNDFQAILSNHPLNAMAQNTREEMTANNDGFEWITTYKDLKANYQFSKEYQLDKTSLQQESSKATFNCTYSNFTTFDTVVFPTQCAIEAKHDQQQGGFTLTFDKLTFNTPLNISRPNLSEYNRVGLDQILPY